MENNDGKHMLKITSLTHENKSNSCLEFKNACYMREKTSMVFVSQDESLLVYPSTRAGKFYYKITFWVNYSSRIVSLLSISAFEKTSVVNPVFDLEAKCLIYRHVRIKGKQQGVFWNVPERICGGESFV